MESSRSATATLDLLLDAWSHPAPHHVVGLDGRLRIDVYREGNDQAALANDVRRGLTAPRKTLPPKYFYDDHGARLFDAICDLPEYYLTRTEQALLTAIADDVIEIVQPSGLVEFGSGASRKTRILLDAVERSGRELCYVPIDVSAGMLHQSALALLHEYPELNIHAVVGDYEHDLDRLPPGRNRLIIFLGSTIGNLTAATSIRFLAEVRRHLARGDHFLLGVDLVKPIPILEAAYNDAAGVTAEFNLNMLRVINRELDADFDLDRFEHLAFFNRRDSQIEMHLRARTAHTVPIRALDLDVPFSAGETIHTEISRKFTASTVTAILIASGYELTQWYTPAGQEFGLALARVR